MTSRVRRRARHRRHKARSGGNAPRLLWSIAHVDLGEQTPGHLTSVVRAIPFVSVGSKMRPARDDEARPVVVTSQTLKLGEPHFERHLRTVDLIEACQRMEVDFLRMLRPYRKPGPRQARRLMSGQTVAVRRQGPLLLNGQPISCEPGGLGG